MRLGRPVHQIVGAGSVIRAVALTFYCEGGSWGKPKHPRQTERRNKKGGVQASHAHPPKVADLPSAVRVNWPRCCGQPTIRKGTYKSLRTGKMSYAFLCRECKKRVVLDAQGKPHEPFHYSAKRIRYCPECGKRLWKLPRPSRRHPDLELFACGNHSQTHQRRYSYIHRKTGRAYEMVRGGSGRWEARLIKSQPDFSPPASRQDGRLSTRPAA